MIINNNIPALNTHRQMGINQNAMQSSMEKLSSGLRINRAGDDAAGLAISEKMRAQINGLDQASRNAQDGISLIQTAEGALDETHSILQRMRELAVQSANDTNVDVDREELQKEVDQLAAELTRISETTEFNTQNLLDGSLNNKFHIGANQGQNIGLQINNMSAESLEVVSDVTTVGQSGGAVTGLSADLGFDIESYNLTAEAGGAINATLTSDSGAVLPDGFAENIETGFAAGITITGTVSTGDIEISAYDGFDWSNIDVSSTNTIVISATNGGASVRVIISAQGDDGSVFSSNDVYALSSNGGFSYNEHGVSFDLNSISTSGELTLDLQSLASTDAIKSYETFSNFSINTAAANANNVPSFSDIGISAGSLISGASHFTVNAGDFSSTDGTGTFTVTIYNAANEAIATDVYTDFVLDTTGGGSFSYDNHGISFTISDITDQIAPSAGALATIDFGSATPGGSGDITVIDNAVEITGTAADRTLTFDIKDDGGVSRTVNVVFSGGTYSLDDIATAINAAVSGSAFSSAVAVVDNSAGTIRLESQFEGTSTITIQSDVANLFNVSNGAEARNGASSSVDLTLANGSNSISQTIAPDANSVRFVDDNGNVATFDLRGYDDVTGLDIGSVFAASDFRQEVSGIDISSNEAADAAITTINNAIETVSAERSKLGAIQNRLEHTISNLDNISENLSAAESRIRDVDMAQEMMEMTRANILSQASQSMLAQANQQPQSVLQLLG